LGCDGEDQVVGLKQLVSKITDKHFLIIPISDGSEKRLLAGRANDTIRELEQDGYTDAEIQMIALSKDIDVSQTGRHWSVAVVDCRHKALNIRYFDSYGVNGHQENLKALPDVLFGLHYIFENIRREYHDFTRTNVEVDENVPSQWTDNPCTDDKAGACGPFVYAIAKESTQYIVECREDAERSGQEVDMVDIDIALPDDFVQRWSWDSEETKKSLKQLIERERKSRVYLNSTHEWFDDTNTGKEGWQSWLRARNLPLDYFWDSWDGLNGVDERRVSF
jgi:hypothetical protein